MPVGSFYFGACLPPQKKRQAAAKNDDDLVWSLQPNAFACLSAALRDDVSKGWDSVSLLQLIHKFLAETNV